MTDPKNMDFREWMAYSDKCQDIRFVRGGAMCARGDKYAYCYYSGCPMRKGEA